MAERNPYSGRKEFDSESGQRSSDPGAGDMAGEARERATEMASRAQEMVSETAEKAGSQIGTRLSGQKDWAAESVGSIAEAVRQTSHQLRQQDQRAVAEYADIAANEIDRLSTYLQESDLGDLVGEVESFARRQPALFLGGALILGFMGARFLKSSSRHRGATYPPAIEQRDPYAGRYGPGAGRTFTSPSTSAIEREASYREPAPFRPRGSILPSQHEEVLGPEMPTSDVEPRRDEPRGSVRRWPAGESPAHGTNPQPGTSNDPEEK
jgi:hypothetical protein